MTYEERQKWFYNRIGKAVYRNKVSCQCTVCQRGYDKGVLISDETHASYLNDVEASINGEGVPLEYFDTIEERDKFQNKINSSHP
ncbi:hypothetical protein KAR91_46275 [Candidatus Pacearchaeota archaeon]|nr:hypothetical protein [Candidatus Pacearchaeota archaeon]